MDPNLVAMKKKAYQGLKDALIIAMEKNEITEENTQESAEYITTQLDLVANHGEFMVFLERLINKWPIYRNVFIGFKSEETQKKDTEKLSEVQNRLKQLISTQ